MIFFWLGIVKNGCQQSGLWTLKLTVSQGRADGMIFGGHGKK